MFSKRLECVLLVLMIICLGGCQNINVGLFSSLKSDATSSGSGLFQQGYIRKTLNLAMETADHVIKKTRKTARDFLSAITLGLIPPKVDEKRPPRPDITPGLLQRKSVTNARTYKLMNKLDGEGVRVITLGQDYRVIIPIDKVFYTSSPRIIWKSYSILNDVVDYLKQFRMVSVSVSAYSKDKNRPRAGALSFARAQEISNYLWSQAIDTRLIYIQAHNIENVTCCPEQPDVNVYVQSSIEISFREAIV